MTAEMEPSASTVTFSYVREDLADSWKAQWRVIPFLKLLRVAPYLMVLLNLLPTAYAGLTQGDWRLAFWNGVWASLGVFLIGLHVYNYRILTPKRAGRVLAHQAALQGPMTVSWTARGVEFGHATGDQHVAWTDFAKWIESPASLALMESETVMRLIPKRRMTARQLAEIKGFLAPVEKLR